MSEVGKNTIQQLREQILLMEGIKQPSIQVPFTIDCSSLEAVFPYATFPIGVMHEFLTVGADVGATTGFIASILGKLIENDGVCLWAGIATSVFPAALKSFGLDPHKVIFIDVKNEKDLAWVIEEALKCEKFSAVIGEIRDISLTASRRFTLAIEQSGVTGFIVRHQPKNLNPISSTARWCITSLPGHPVDGLAGLGFPHWNVELLKVRSGKPRQWQIEWRVDHFAVIDEKQGPAVMFPLRKTAS